MLDCHFDNSILFDASIYASQPLGGEVVHRAIRVQIVTFAQLHAYHLSILSDVIYVLHVYFNFAIKHI